MGIQRSEAVVPGHPDLVILGTLLYLRDTDDRERPGAGAWGTTAKMGIPSS